MLYWALVEEARHEYMSDEYENRYLFQFYSFAEAHILGLPDKHEITPVVPSELIKRGKVKRTNTGLPDTYRRSKLLKLLRHPIGQNSLLIYPHF